VFCPSGRVQGWNSGDEGKIRVDCRRYRNLCAGTNNPGPEYNVESIVA